MSMKKAQELKALKTRLSEAEGELTEARRVAKEAQRAEAGLISKRDKLKAQIEAIEKNSAEIVVTEHALLRYIERVFGIDLDEIKERMLEPAAVALIEQFGSGKVPIEGGRLVVKDRTVITVESF